MTGRASRPFPLYASPLYNSVLVVLTCAQVLAKLPINKLASFPATVLVLALRLSYYNVYRSTLAVSFERLLSAHLYRQFTSFESHDFDADAAFQRGLASIPAGSTDAFKQFYYSKMTDIPFPSAVYDKWVSSGRIPPPLNSLFNDAVPSSSDDSTSQSENFSFEPNAAVKFSFSLPTFLSSQLPASVVTSSLTFLASSLPPPHELHASAPGRLPLDQLAALLADNKEIPRIAEVSDVVRSDVGVVMDGARSSAKKPWEK